MRTNSHSSPVALVEPPTRNLRDAINQSEVLTSDLLDKEGFREFLLEWKREDGAAVWMNDIENNQFLAAYLYQKLGFKCHVRTDGIYTWKGGFQCACPSWAQTFICLCRSRNLRPQRKYQTIFLHTALYYLRYCV